MYFREKFNSVSHLLGAVAAIAGTLVLVIPASLHGDSWKVVSFSVYGTSLVALYTVSTFYHSMRDGELKAFLRKLDHNAIYLLIAGTYTPFMLVSLRETLGWGFLALIWGLAVIGMVYDSMPQKRLRIIPVAIYLVMGWLALFIVKPLLQVLPSGAIVGLVLGGVFYTVGIVFYAFSRIRHFHGVWHLFVLAGSISHYFTVLLYIA